MVGWKRLVDEALDPELEAQGSTLIVQNHMAQMKMFTHRGGIEFFPEQDDRQQSRKNFIDAESRYNKLPLKVDRAVDILTGRGELLIYFRPTQNGRYKIHIYEKGQYKAIYDSDGDLNKVIIVYSYEVESTSNMPTAAKSALGSTKWLRLTVTATSILKEEFQSKPGFTNDMSNRIGGITHSTKEYVNSLKFLPCVIVKNYFGDDGREGLSDFFAIRKQLENHDDLIRSLNTNLKYFGNSTFVTSRSAKEILRNIEGSGSGHNDSIAARSGFTSEFMPSSLDKRFFGGGDNEKRITRIIDNIAPDERAGYITPDPITADHALHAREERESIHFALGGIDELGVSANATAYEMKTIYGKIATTAGKKARALFDYGFCIVFEMMIAAEEDLFRQSLAFVLGKELIEITDGFIAELMEKGQLPVEGVFGLPPIGNREISWRYRGEVFEKSPRDLMDESIVVRNLQELGMNAVDALKATNLFENKTHHEIEAILSKGYPFRYIQSILGSSQFFASLYGQMLGLPDITTGGQMPLAAKFPVDQFIAKGFETIASELSHQDRYDPVEAGDPPEYKLGISQFNQYVNNQNNNEPTTTPATNQPVPNLSTADPTIGGWTIPSVYGFPATAAGQPGGSTQYGVGAGYGSPAPEYTAELPTPDTVVNTTGVQPWTQQYFGPVSAGYVPLNQPTVEPIPDDRTNADRTTRKSKPSATTRARRSARSRK